MQGKKDNDGQGNLDARFFTDNYQGMNNKLHSVYATAENTWSLLSSGRLRQRKFFCMRALQPRFRSREYVVRSVPVVDDLFVSEREPRNAGMN